MTDKEKTQLKEIYDKILEQPLNIYSKFLDYYGEERVDFKTLNYDTVESIVKNETIEISYTGIINDIISSFSIIVHFPEVRIENEDGVYVDVKDLWVKVPLTMCKIDYNHPFSETNMECLMNVSFTMTRTNYQMSHLRADYMHSHCPGVPWSDMSVWMKCCLGSGPIKNTVATLTSEYNPDIWELFCVELDKYVSTESLRGGPYRRISSINHIENKRLYKEDNYLSYNTEWLKHSSCRQSFFNMFKDFFMYYIKNYEFPIYYINNSFALAETYSSFRIRLSKIFVDWFNKEDNPWNRMFSKPEIYGDDGVMQYEYVVDNNIICRIYGTYQGGSPRSDVEIRGNIENRELFEFKGVKQKVVIEDDTTNTDINVCHFLNNDIVCFFVSTLIQFINFNYR